MTAGANRAIGKSNRFQRRLSSQEGREMASRVNREVVLWAAGGEIPPADPARRPFDADDAFDCAKIRDAFDSDRIVPQVDDQRQAAGRVRDPADIVHDPTWCGE